jgi:hypothetical protein
MELTTGPETGARRVAPYYLAEIRHDFSQTTVFALFAPVMLVQFAMDNATSLQVHGVQDHHLLVCEAVGIDPAWYQGGATGQNSLPRATPP